MPKLRRRKRVGGEQSLIWLCIVIAILMVLASLYQVYAHESWISRGGHRNGAGEWCCGEGDCFMVPKRNVSTNVQGYVVTVDIVSGIAGPLQVETVPYAEAQPSPDGEFWRCKRPDGTRRCFFAPPPSM